MLKKIILEFVLGLCAMAIGASEFYEGGKKAYNSAKEFVDVKKKADTEEKTEEVTEESE